ncbi:MAG: hypothetical protein D6707_11325, partial [Bacteroidetes bacterium]
MQTCGEIAKTRRAFGMLAPGRVFNSGEYRFGFNGKEDDNEVLGLGRWQDYGERHYRTDLARFFSPDPIIISQKKYPELSPYQFASNTPVQAIDLDGLEPAYFNEVTGYYTTAGDVLQRTLNEKETNMFLSQVGPIRPGGINMSARQEEALTGIINISLGIAETISA